MESFNELTNPAWFDSVLEDAGNASIGEYIDSGDESFSFNHSGSYKEGDFTISVSLEISANRNEDGTSAFLYVNAEFEIEESIDFTEDREKDYWNYIKDYCDKKKISKHMTDDLLVRLNCAKKYTPEPDSSTDTMFEHEELDIYQLHEKIIETIIYGATKMQIICNALSSIKNS